MMSSKPLPFDLPELQVFLAVCETRTMVKAAALLGLTQPAISHVILDMERRIGTALFDRSIRPIALTTTGTVLYEAAAGLLTEVRQIETRLQRSRCGQVPVLRVGLVHSLNRVLSVPLVSALAKSSVQIVVQMGLAAQHTDALLARELDILIGMDEHEQSELGEVAGLERRTLVEESYVLVTPRGMARTELATLAREQPFIRFSARSRPANEIERYLQRAGLEPARGLQFDSPYGVVASVAAGLGWAIASPLCLMEAGTPLKSFDVHPLPRPGLKRSLIMVSRLRELGPIPREAAAVASAAIREQCQTMMKELPSWVVGEMHFENVAATASVSSLQSAAARLRHTA